MLEFVIAVGKDWFVYSLILKLLLQPAITVSKKTLFSGFHVICAMSHQAVSLESKRCFAQCMRLFHIVFCK